MANPPPFSRYEFLIAWRYLRARRAEGGVSTMTWISLIGIALGVMALIATLAVCLFYLLAQMAGAGGLVSLLLGIKSAPSLFSTTHTLDDAT